MAQAARVYCEVVFIDAQGARQYQLAVTLATDACTAYDAIQASGILRIFPCWQVTELKLGVYSRRVQLAEQLQSGDRLEIYAPLQVSPAQARQLRVQAQRRKAQQAKQAVG